MNEAKTTYEMLYRNQLTIDLRVQRVGDVNRQKKIAANFNAAALGEITVSRRDDGTNALLNGQNRVGAAGLAGYPGPFRAEVHHGLTVQQEAELFILLNNFKAPTAVSKFLVRVTWEDPDAVGIKNVLDELGWRVDLAGADGCISAVDALESIYTTGAGVFKAGSYSNLLACTLGTVTQAWGHDQKGANGNLLKGVAQLYARFGSSVKTDKLIREMQRTPPQTVISRARVLQGIQGGIVPAAVAKTLVGMHNKGLRANPLPEWVWTR